MESNQEPYFFASPAYFRAWLLENHESDYVLWMGYYKKGSGLQSINWPESGLKAYEKRFLLLLESYKEGLRIPML
jgi:uncharacterized protein YdeI (YjbR/CyaY-like superfamily)